MCATQAHGLRPFPQGECACAGLPWVRALEASLDLRLVQANLRESNCHKGQVGYNRTKQMRKSYLPIYLHRKEAPSKGVDAIMVRQALGVAWLPTDGEGLRQTDVESGVCLAGAELLAQNAANHGSSELAA